MTLHIHGLPYPVEDECGCCGRHGKHGHFDAELQAEGVACRGTLVCGECLPHVRSAEIQLRAWTKYGATFGTAALARRVESFDRSERRQPIKPFSKGRAE